MNILFTGFQPADLGKKIMDFVRAEGDENEVMELRIGAYTAQIKRKLVGSTTLFSGHGDQLDLDRFGQIGGRILLVHGSPKTAHILAEKLGGAEIVEKNTPIQLF